MSLVRIVAHDVAHVHLDIKLFKVDGEHHQRLPWRTLRCCCFSVAERRGGGLGNRVCRNTQTRHSFLYVSPRAAHHQQSSSSMYMCTSARCWGIGHTAGTSGGRWSEVYVAWSGISEDGGGGVLSGLAIPCSPVRFTAGLRRQVLRDALHRVWCGRTWCYNTNTALSINTFRHSSGDESIESSSNQNLEDLKR